MSASLVHLLRDAVRRYPRNEALVFGDERVSYQQLWDRVGAFAGFLRSRGLAPGARVALVVENCPEYVVAYYGVLAAGGTVVALNTAARERDLVNWIDHAGARWVVAQTTHAACPALAPSHGEAQVVGVGSDSIAGCIPWAQVVAQPCDVVLDSFPIDGPAAIIYTSGTTGKPKGVTLSHANLVANVRSILGYLPIDRDTRTLNVLPFYYSYGNSVLHTHLASGACLVLENGFTYPHHVLERMVKERVTGFNGVPSTYALLMARVQFEDYDLSALRYVTQAGGAMAPAVVERLSTRLPGVQIFVMYGQTEATARLSYLPPAMLSAKLGSAGIPIPGVRLEIRGDAGEALPPGAVGEIYAHGANIMQGYWRDAQASAAVLTDGWLKTGDLGYLDKDGYLFIKGRRSDMIKSGAHRINPNDIEEAISEIDGVAEVAVVGVEDEILGQVIKAVVVPGPGRTLDVRTIKAHCRERLAAYKIPKYIEFAHQLPRTASGKVKRFELAAMANNDN